MDPATGDTSMITVAADDVPRARQLYASTADRWARAHLSKDLGYQRLGVAKAGLALRQKTAGTTKTPETAAEVLRLGQLPSLRQLLAQPGGGQKAAQWALGQGYTPAAVTAYALSVPEAPEQEVAECIKWATTTGTSLRQQGKPKKTGFVTF